MCFFYGDQYIIMSGNHFISLGRKKVTEKNWTWSTVTWWENQIKWFNIQGSQ